MEKQTLSIKVSSFFYNRLRTEIGKGKISKFIEDVGIKQLNDKQEKLRQKLISDYQSIAKNKDTQKEMNIWDETISDMWRKDE